MLSKKKKSLPSEQSESFLDGQGTELIRKYTEKDGNMYLESISNCHKSLYYTDDIICLGTVLGIIREAEKYEPDTL